MYYEEKMIDGKLCWRGMPNGEWLLCAYSTLTERLIDMQAKYDELHKNYTTLAFRLTEEEQARLAAQKLYQLALESELELTKQHGKDKSELMRLNADLQAKCDGLLSALESLNYSASKDSPNAKIVAAALAKHKAQGVQS